MTGLKLIELINSNRINGTSGVIIVPSAIALIEVYGIIVIYDHNHKISYNGVDGIDIHFNDRLCVTLKLVTLEE